MQEYLQFHVSAAARPKKVRIELFPATNHGLDEPMHARVLQAGELGRTHPHAPPPPGSGDPAAHPEFARLKALLEEGSVNSLVKRSRHWAKRTSVKAGGATGDGKHKPAAGQVAHKEATWQARKGTGDGGRVFKAGLPEGNTPPGVCEYGWRGDTCPQSSCRYSHDQVTPVARSGAPAPERRM